MPNAKRNARKVKGAVRPIFVAMKPEPHTATKYQASAGSSQRRSEKVCKYRPGGVAAPLEKSESIREPVNRLVPTTGNR